MKQINDQMSQNLIKPDSIMKELIVYFSLVYLLTWLCWAPSFSIEFSHLTQTILLNLGNFMPSLLAIILVISTRKKEKVLGMISRVFKLRFSIFWYLFAICLMPAILGMAYLTTNFMIGLEFKSLLLPIILPNLWPLIPLVGYFIAVQGPLGEELGWRGYALPKLFQLFNPFKSSMILGIVWAIWHFPKFFLDGSIQFELADAYGVMMALAGYTLYTILLTLMITLLFVKTNGSVWAAMLFHAMSNFSNGLVTILLDTTGAISMLALMILFTFLMAVRNKELYFKQLIV